MRVFLAIFSVLISLCTYAQNNTFETPEINGPFTHIFNPNDTRSKEDTTWYTNDHSFIKGSDGNWHAYGIIGHKPIRPCGRLGR